MKLVFCGTPLKIESDWGQTCNSAIFLYEIDWGLAILQFFIDSAQTNRENFPNSNESSQLMDELAFEPQILKPSKPSL